MSRDRNSDQKTSALSDEQLLEHCRRAQASRGRRDRLRLQAGLAGGLAALVGSAFVDWSQVLSLEVLGLLSLLAFVVLVILGILVLSGLQGREARARDSALERAERLSSTEAETILQAEWAESVSGCGIPVFGGVAIGAALLAANFFLPLPERVRFAFPPVVVAFALGFLLVRILLAAVGREEGGAREQLELRYGAGPRGAYLQQARATLEQDGAPDWIALLTGTGLPHGARHFIRVDIWSAAPRGRVEVRSSPRWGWDETEADGFVRGEAELPEGAERELARRFEAGGLEDVRPGVIDGFPCTVTVLCREPASEASVSCNLGGSPDPEHPTIALAQRLLAIGEGVPTSACEAGE